jgi:predicted lipoprotein
MLAGCASPGAPDTRRVLLGQWTTELIVPLYGQFAARTETLEASLVDLCSEPDAARLDAARGSWASARKSWKQAEVFAFGPYSRPEFRIGPRIDSWPARVDRIEEVIAGETPVTSEQIAGLSVWQRGLPVVEYLLYAPNDGALESLPDARRCETLVAVGQDLANQAEAMRSAWDPNGGNFAAELSEAGRGTTAFRSLRDAFGQVVNRIGFTLENARSDKLGRPLGEAAGEVQPDQSESRFSGRSIEDLNDALDGIEWLYFGGTSVRDGGASFDGLSRYATERGQALDAPIRAALTQARDALSAVGAPVHIAVVDNPAAVTQVSTQFEQLQRLFQVDLIGALGLSLSFNDNDGD